MLTLLLACATPPARSAPSEDPAPPEAPAPSAARTVGEAFPAPPGATRVPADGWGAWLQARPVLPPDVPVRTFDGREVGHRARVIDLPLVPGDLQQCADSALRLRAEYLRETGVSPSFHATSGDELPWARAQREHPVLRGERLGWAPGGLDWDHWLAAVFTWAGTRSVQAYDSVPLAAPVPGAILVEGGSPGHLVVLLDVATAGDRTWLLVGEGYMPAQSFHVELGPDAGWWPWEGGLDLGHWAFEEDDLRVFR